MHNSLQPYSNFSDTARWRSRRIYLVGALGTVIEWYDFALYACFANVFTTVFFANQHNSILMVYVIFFVSYLVRPIGGLLYGLLGDYVGRKPALLLSISMMSGCMFIMAMLPSQKLVGAFAPVLLLVFRIVQGLSVGGETAGALVYVLESVEQEQQGFFGSATWSMAWVGVLIATITVVLLMHFLNHAHLYLWGWRLAYFTGGLAGLFIFVMRMGIPESLEFYAEKQRLRQEKSSDINKGFLLKEVVVNHKLLLFKILALLAFVCAIDECIYTYFPVYLHQYFSIHLVTGWSLQIIVGMAGILCLILSGTLSDRLGRKRLPMIAAGCFLLLSYPLFSLLAVGQSHIDAIILILFAMTLAVYEGPLPSLLVRLIPLQVRYTVFALAYNIAWALFGGSAPLICVILARISPQAPAFYFMALASVALVVLCFIKKPSEEVGQPQPVITSQPSELY